MLRDLMQAAQDSVNTVKDSMTTLVEEMVGRVQNCDAIRPPDPARVNEAKEQIEEMGRLRGRALIYPMVPTGRGSGPFIELTDGSVKLDMIAGIGTYLFGHGHPELILASLKASLRAPTMQGTLMPGREYADVCRLLLASTGKVAHLDESATSNLAAVWLSSCGTMANELALKIVRQKKAPAYKMIAFKNCFAGRSAAMQELTDEPKYREGQPTFDQFTHIDFFDDALDVAANVARTRGAIDAVVNAEPGLFAGICFEPVQGEGGAFRSAPKEWWTAILGHARSRGLGIWFDEVQTFGRTGEMFAYQRLGLGEFVDVLTLAKPLNAAAVMWTAEYAPKPGLIAGTFAGSTTALAMGAKTLEMLNSGGYFGPEGRIQRLENFILQDWEERRTRVGGKFRLGRVNIVGGMVCFEMLDGKADTMKKFLNLLFENGVIGFSAGRDPVMLRFLPPVGILTEAHWTLAMDTVEKTLQDFMAGVD